MTAKARQNCETKKLKNDPGLREFKKIIHFISIDFNPLVSSWCFLSWVWWDWKGNFGADFSCYWGGFIYKDLTTCAGLQQLELPFLTRFPTKIEALEPFAWWNPNMIWVESTTFIPIISDSIARENIPLWTSKWAVRHASEYVYPLS